MRFSRQDITHQAEKAGWTPDVFERAVRLLLLLPDDAVFCNNLRQHPALLWKIHNVRAQARKQ